MPFFVFCISILSEHILFEHFVHARFFGNAIFSEAPPDYHFTRKLMKQYSTLPGEELTLTCTLNIHKAAVRWFKDSTSVQTVQHITHKHIHIFFKSYVMLDWFLKLYLDLNYSKKYITCFYCFSIL